MADASPKRKRPSDGESHSDEHRHIENGADRDLPFVAADPARAKTLSADEVERYNREGYLSPLDVFDPEEADGWRGYFDTLIQDVLDADDGRNGYSINGYHISNKGLWDLATTPRILDLVEDILGPDVVLWSTHLFAKLPGNPMEVPLHQDGVYWPFTSTKTVTVWLAIDDVDAGNGAMVFVPGSHRLGPLPYEELALDGTRVLGRQTQDADQYTNRVLNTLRAGQASLHSDLLLHGSAANTSQRRRAGLTLRYAAAGARMEEGWDLWKRGAVHVRGASDPWWPDVARPNGEDTHRFATYRGNFDGVPA